MIDKPSPSLRIVSSYCWLSDNDLSSDNYRPSLLKNCDLDDISLKQIPPIKRRRLNGLSKMAMHSSLQCLERATVDPADIMTVFASQHGELNRTITIVNDMSSDQEVSPKDFSLSVHNAALGLYSIFNGNKHPGTSIAASSNTFGFALLESFNLLQRFPGTKVLLTCFDSLISQPFDKLQPYSSPSYSLSLLLSLDEGQPLSFAFQRSKAELSPTIPLSLAFFEFLHSDHDEHTIDSDDTHWEFSKHAL
ncbi:beta-ketoacyl synthase chain length factor [Kangiella marina]|uniref:Beta-ketoacyl synthase chain length factor n=1 Tax=Kangiella marina TaxID=1079178 RepID=A0ABP8IJL3_9GAMM